MGDDEGRERPIRAYLAGPGVFLRDPTAHAEGLRRVCRDAGVEGVYPLDAEVDVEGLAPAEVALAIRLGNERLIEGCDLLVADVTPFRGPGMDGGTAYEMGYARALRIPVVGYAETPGDYASRVPRHPDPGEAGRDPDGLSIEDFGLADNLMMAAGTTVAASLAEALAHGVAAVRAWREGEAARLDLGPARYEAGRRMREVTLGARTWEEAAERFAGVALRLAGDAERGG